MTSNADVTAATNGLDGPLRTGMQQPMTKLAVLQIHPNDQCATSLMHKQWMREFAKSHDNQKESQSAPFDAGVLVSHSARGAVNEICFWLLLHP